MKAFWMCLPLLLAAAPAGAQVVSGSVEGLFGGPVPHASVSVLNEEGIVVAHRITDRGGRFTAHVPVGGIYLVRVLADEFHPSTQTVRVRDNGTATARVRLHERHSSTSRMDQPRGLRSNGLPPKDPGGGSGGGAKPGGGAGSDN